MFGKYSIIIFAILTIAISGIAQEFELITPHQVDLGTVMQDSVVEAVIQFRNSGDAPLKISRVQTSCGCTAADLQKLEYLPGEEGEIGVKLNTKGFSGLIRKYVTIYLEDGDPISTRVVLQTTVKSQFEIQPAYLDFQSIELKSKENGRSLRVTNNFDGPLIIEALLTNIKNLGISATHMTIQPGATEEITITYEPLQVGRADGYIDVKIKDPIETVKRIPVFIYVTKDDQS
jgi:hypothetical protein